MYTSNNYSTSNPLSTWLNSTEIELANQATQPPTFDGMEMGNGQWAPTVQFCWEGLQQGWLAWMEWRPAGWSMCLPLLIFPCTIKSRSSFLAPDHLGDPGKRAIKRLWCGGGLQHRDEHLAPYESVDTSDDKHRASYRGVIDGLLFLTFRRLSSAPNPDARLAVVHNETVLHVPTIIHTQL